MKEFSVIGAGSWGTVLSNLLALNGYKVKIWTKNNSIYEEIQTANKNSKYLPNLHLSENVSPTLDLKKCFGDEKTVIIAIPSDGIKIISKEIKNFHRASNRYILASKGIDLKTFETMSETCLLYTSDAADD